VYNKKEKFEEHIINAIINASDEYCAGKSEDLSQVRLRRQRNPREYEKTGLGWMVRHGLVTDASGI
jgi:hypothetical protein